MPKITSSFLSLLVWSLLIVLKSHQILVQKYSKRDLSVRIRVARKCLSWAKADVVILVQISCQGFYPGWTLLQFRDGPRAKILGGANLSSLTGALCQLTCGKF